MTQQGVSVFDMRKFLVISALALSAMSCGIASPVAQDAELRREAQEGKAAGVPVGQSDQWTGATLQEQYELQNLILPDGFQLTINTAGYMGMEHEGMLYPLMFEIQNHVAQFVLTYPFVDQRDLGVSEMPEFGLSQLNLVQGVKAIPSAQFFDVYMPLAAQQNVAQEAVWEINLFSADSSALSLVQQPEPCNGLVPRALCCRGVGYPTTPPRESGVINFPGICGAGSGDPGLGAVFHLERIADCSGTGGPGGPGGGQQTGPQPPACGPGDSGHFNPAVFFLQASADRAACLPGTAGGQHGPGSGPNVGGHGSANGDGHGSTGSSHANGGGSGAHSGLRRESESGGEYQSAAPSVAATPMPVPDAPSVGIDLPDAQSTPEA